MKTPIQNKRIHAMRLRMMAVGVLAGLSGVSAGAETPDVNAYLPLFERNSLGRKVLDVSYSVNCEANSSGNEVNFGKWDVRLVFDDGSKKFREEAKYYNSPNDADAYTFVINLWDGKEAVEWHRLVTPRLRALGGGAFTNTPGLPGLDPSLLNKISPIPFFVARIWGLVLLRKVFRC